METVMEADVDVKVSDMMETAEGQVEFNGASLQELDTITLEPDSYLETLGDYMGAEAIMTYFGELVSGLGDAFSDASDAYADKVEESAQERQNEKLQEALEEPTFSRGEVNEMIEDAQTKIEAAEAKVTAAGNVSDLDGAATAHARPEAVAEETTTAPALQPEPQPVAEPPASPVAEPIEGDVYTVRSGDSLSKIAEREYGDPSRWMEIYEANREVVGNNPNVIHPGQQLTIPPYSESGGYNNVIIPTPPEPQPPQPTQPGGDEVTDYSPEDYERVEALEDKIASLTADPQGITERNVTNDPALDGQRIALKDDLNELDRDYLRNEITPETVDEYEARYESLHNQYHQVSAGLYENHVAAVPLQYADDGVLDRLLYNNTTIARAMERGDVAEVDRVLDDAWRDYDDAKMGVDTTHRMPGGHIPNPGEGQAISAAANIHNDDGSGGGNVGGVGRAGGSDGGSDGGGKSGGGSDGGSKSGGGSSPGSGGPSGGGGLKPIGG